MRMRRATRWWVVVVCVLTLLAGIEAKRKDGRPVNPFTGVPQQQVKRQPGDDRPERVQLSQRATLLPENATDMSHPDVQSRLRCNACLVASAEIASAVRDYWMTYKNAEQKAGRTPQKISQDKSKALLFSACEKGGEVEKYGLIQEMNGRVMATFSKEDSPQARELLKFTVHRAPGVQAALKEACDGLLTDYWGDFLHIITQEHQTATVQRRLCGPEPGLGACKATEVPDDMHVREAKFQKRMHRDEMDYQRRQWEANVDFLTNPDPLADLIKEDAQPPPPLKQPQADDDEHDEL